MDQHRHIRWRFKMSGHVDAHTSFPLVGNRGGRARLAEIFNDFGYKTGVEVGTCQGEFAEVLCKAIPGVRLTCVDPWTQYEAHRRLITQDVQDRNFAETTERLAKYGVTILRKPSMEAVSTFADNSLDFAFVDGDHKFDDVMLDIICWSRKVRSGGILAGHDYLWYPDITRAVHAYVASHSYVHPWYMLRDRMGGTFFWIMVK